MGKGRYTVALYEFHVAFLNPINNPYPSLKKISIPLFSGTRVPGPLGVELCLRNRAASERFTPHASRRISAEAPHTKLRGRQSPA